MSPRGYIYVAFLVVLAAALWWWVHTITPHADDPDAPYATPAAAPADAGAASRPHY